MIGERKRIITGVEWQAILTDWERERYTKRLAKVGLELKDVQYLDVDGGDVTAYAFHKDAAHQSHPEGHCDKPAWAHKEEASGEYMCSCGKNITIDGDDHDFCLKPVVI